MIFGIEKAESPNSARLSKPPKASGGYLDNTRFS
jgi:hypothetical protein